MKAILFISFFLFQSLALNVEGGMQRIIVRGRLLCGISPAADIKLKMFDEDIGFDDLMDEKRTNGTGHFTMDGFTRENTNIDPLVKIYHDCDDALACQRRVMLYVPKKYINHGEQIHTETNIASLHVFDIGVINLETHIYGEDRDCFHKK